MNAPDRAALRLTALSHGGGCGCKVAPAVLREMLAGVSTAPVPRELLVGLETGDDAAVYQINDHQAVVATTDFFTPIVDDPFDFGAIAATNALSDVYAMGGTPLFALALVGMPVGKLPVEIVRSILQGGEAICAKAGIPIAGGHTIDAPEPIYGLVAIGTVDPKRVKRNAGARAGDTLILGKPIGVGIYSAALKKSQLNSDRYATMVETTTQLNTPGIALAAIDEVHAMTDVTGFGLLGHLLAMCRASNASAQIRFDRLPLLGGAAELAGEGFATGASGRNWASYGNEVVLGDAVGALQRTLLTDPQTSGGLLVACAGDATERVLALFRDQGFEQAAVIGEIVAGPSRVEVSRT